MSVGYQTFEHQARALCLVQCSAVSNSPVGCLCFADAVRVSQKQGGQRVRARFITVALLDTEPLRSIMCGENAYDRCAISKYVSH
jgi:hypothetical protein